MDEPWIRCFPYEQVAKPGSEAALDVVVTNHSTAPKTAACRAVLPRAWHGGASPWHRAEVAPKSEKPMRLVFSIPGDVPPGRYVIPIDVKYAGRDLPQFTEAIAVLPAAHV